MTGRLLLAPQTVADLYLAAILAALDDIRDRLPVSGGPVRIAEPAPTRRPDKAIPVQEPAPSHQPDDDEKPVTEPAPDPPPRAGRGSGLTAWQVFAAAAGVDLDDDMTRDDIIAACDLAGAIQAKP